VDRPAFVLDRRGEVEYALIVLCASFAAGFVLLAWFRLAGVHRALPGGDLGAVDRGRTAVSAR
jgi:hypothetical protein